MYFAIKVLTTMLCGGLLFACVSGSSERAGTQPINNEKQFERITTAESGIGFQHGYENPTAYSMPEMFAGGAAAGDYDNDGDIDLFIVRGDMGPNLLYSNRGDGSFIEVAEKAGLAYTKSPAGSHNYRHSGPAFADLDGDADLDLFIGGIEGDPSKLYQNNGDGTFTDVTPGSGIDNMGSHYTISAAFGDYDLDGDLDMFLSHWGTSRAVGNPGRTEHLWRNDSSDAELRFTDVSLEAGISGAIIMHTFEGALPGDRDYTFTPTFVRIDDDEYPDILSVADFGTTRVFINNGDGTFRDVTDTDQITDRNGMGSAVGDYDNDGDLDWFVSAIWSGDTRVIGNQLYRNNDGTFENVTDRARVIDGGFGWAACFADFDNDQWLDLYHTNGWAEDGDVLDKQGWETDRGRLFISNGDGSFTELSSERGTVDDERGLAVVCADFDSDGDVDIFVTTRNASNAHLLFRNKMAEFERNSSLSVTLAGDAPNTQAAGARIKVTVGDITQTREITIGSNFTSQNPTTQLFGLGAEVRADRVEIEWPSIRSLPSQVDNYTNIPAGSMRCTPGECVTTPRQRLPESE